MEMKFGNNGQESGTSVLAVGNSTSARQVQYVSAGLISADSTDAINGSQLYNVITVVNSTVSTATLAQATADNAKTVADDAKTKAERADDAAAGAKGTANNALVLATTANTTANNALELANQAANIYFHVMMEQRI